MDEKWIDIVNADMRKCNEIRIRLEEHDKTQEEKIKGNERLVEQLFDYKNAMLKKITYLEVNKVDRTEMDQVNHCITILKTEKKFLPYVALVISILAGMGTLVFTIIKTFMG